jgi:WD40 repeat protein
MTLSLAGGRVLTGLGVIAFCLACDTPTPSRPAEVGSIGVSSVTTGTDPDGDGYTVIVDGQAVSSIDANGSIVIDDVVVGTHTVELVGIATNCTAAGATQQVSVVAALRISAAFTITCIARSPGPLSGVGTLRITTATSGVDRDADGYTALVSNLNSFTNAPLPVEGTVSINLAAGSRYFIVLGGMAPNCRIQTEVSPDQVVDVVADAIASVSFSVTCGPVYPSRLPPGSQLAFVRNGGIHLVNSDGTGIVRLTDGPSDCAPSWSPDGLRLAFMRGCSQSTQIFIMNADGTNLVARAHGVSPAWSPDGKRIVFSAVSQGALGVFVLSADEDGESPVEIVNQPGWNGDPSWSPDGNRIAFVSDRVAYDFTYDIFVTPVAGGLSTQLTNGFNFWPNLVQYFQPAWSPDGARLAVVRCPQAYYTCDHSDIVLMNANGSGVTSLVATRGYARPTWSPDGSVIAFSSGGAVGWVRPPTSERGFIVADGHSPAWRPMPPN